MEERKEERKDETTGHACTHAPLDVEAVDGVLPLAPPGAAEDDDVLIEGF